MSATVYVGQAEGHLASRNFFVAEGVAHEAGVRMEGFPKVAAWLDRVGDALPLGAVRLGPGRLHPLTLLWALSGSFMISKTLRIPKL